MCREIDLALRSFSGRRLGDGLGLVGSAFSVRWFGRCVCLHLLPCRLQGLAAISCHLPDHLRAVAPLPTAELEALRRSIAEVGAIGRNLNQIARAVNQGLMPNGPTRAEIHTLLRGLNNLKDQIKAVLAANLNSWRDGHEKAIG